MKYLLIVMSFIPFFVYAQDGLEIEYEEVSIPKFIGKDGKEEKLEDEFIAALSIPKNYVLQIENERSVFTKIDKINNLQGVKTVTMLGILSYNLELDFNLNKMRQEWLIEHKKYIVSDTISAPYKYELTQEKSTYLGFDVKKAIIRFSEADEIIIWYAPDLPKRFGPKDYINLPGLVLKVEAVKNGKIDPSYSLKATAVVSKNQLDFKKLFKGKEITKSQFEQLKVDYDKHNSNIHHGVDKD